jgi:hypothetical protein
MDAPTADQPFEIRRIVVAPGAERPYDESEWEDALVVIESGKLELEYRGGERRRFGRGDVLWLIGLPLRVLRNCGADPTTLVAVTRLRTARTGHFDPGR